MLAEKAGEEAALVAALFQFDEIGALERRRVEFHDARPRRVRPCQRKVASEPAGHVALQHLETHEGELRKSRSAKPIAVRPSRSAAIDSSSVTCGDVLRRQRANSEKSTL